MDYKKIIKENLNNTLESSEIAGLGKKIDGKVRDIYLKDDKIILITTDRQSAFDRNLAFVPFKGQVLTQTSSFWFDQTKDIVPNHVLDMPDPNIVVGKKCDIFPVEFVVRGYLTGVTSTSAWTVYSSGERKFCGNILPDGMKKNQKFIKPILTPTTKSDEHDEAISAEEIVSEGLMSKEDWDKTAALAIAVFERGVKVAAKNNLILVDTKYEFGKDEDGNIILCDEIHTPDSSRYWLMDSYQERINSGQEPENIDKEFLRLWFKDNCDPYKDEVLPEAPTELIVELSAKYIKLYEMITGNSFDFGDGETVNSRMEKNLKDKGYI